MTKADIIQQLGLTAHPTEGGYFRRTYESSFMVSVSEESRRAMTSIYYMLTDDSPIGTLHRNKSDILHYHHQGSSINYLIIKPSGQYEELTLGPSLAKGEVPQLLVKGGDWKLARLSSGEYGLLSEAVSPGFEYEDNELLTAKHILDWPKALQLKIKPFLPESSYR